jgi:hypothetical protein
MQMDYDVFSRSRAENAITRVESVVEFKSIASNTGTITHAGKADPTKTPTKVDCGLRTRHVNEFSVPVNGKRSSRPDSAAFRPIIHRRLVTKADEWMDDLFTSMDQEQERARTERNRYEPNP